MTDFDDVYKEWDAAYVLGALSYEERKEYEAHLTQCSACSGALALLAGIPGFLGKIDSQTAIGLMSGSSTDPTSDSMDESVFMQKLATRAGQERRKTRIRQTIGLVAAVVISVSVGLTTGVLVHNSHGVTTAPANALATSWHLTNLQPEIMSANLHITSKTWGTHFDWSCTYSKNAAAWGPSVRYNFVVTDYSGRKSTVATWSPSGGTAKGLSATTALSQSQIKMLEVTITGSANPIIVGVKV